MSQRLKALAEAGVSIWLDDLSRERIETGNLADLVKNRSVVGVTTNPTIFAAALADGERYDAQVRRLAALGTSVEDAVFELTTDDVQRACDIMMDTWTETGGVDGRVSIEVPPGLAFDTEKTVAAARALWMAVERPNLLVKVPATAEGIPAISALLGDGVNVNVTLIFGIDRYKAVMDAYLEGLEKATSAGHDLHSIHSVASFFVSRVDSEVDKRLDALDADGVADLKGRAGIANARLAYKEFEDVFSSDRFVRLKDQGAREQRPLWASTGVKDPDYADTMYVTELVVPNTVNTMPEKTLEAFADHGEVHGDRITAMYDDAEQVIGRLAELGVRYDDVIETLEREGVEKFVASWDDLVDTVRDSMEVAAR
jgi:transaldolase